MVKNSGVLLRQYSSGKTDLDISLKMLTMHIDFVQNYGSVCSRKNLDTAIPEQLYTLCTSPLHAAMPAQRIILLAQFQLVLNGTGFFEGTGVRIKFIVGLATLVRSVILLPLLILPGNISNENQKYRCQVNSLGNAAAVLHKAQ